MWERNIACDDRLMSDDAVVLGGEFWVADNPDIRVRGEFKAEAGTNPEVTLDAGLVNDPRVRPSGSGSPSLRRPLMPAKRFSRSPCMENSKRVSA